MEKNYIYDLMLNHFVSNERQNLRKVHVQNGYLYASDGHFLIRIKQDKCAKQYAEVPDFPDTEKFFRNTTHKTYIIQTDDLVRLLAEVVWTRLTSGDDCKECKGTGSISCHYCSSKIECNDCDGTGKTVLRSGVMTLLKSDDRTYSIRINECAYLADHLYIIALMAKLSKADEIRYTYSENGIFSFEGVEILVNPVHVDGLYGNFSLMAKARLKVEQL